eukprot:COSAG01_NODE_1615_length_9724_cov_156.868725_5_plen_94_part_00
MSRCLCAENFSGWWNLAAADIAAQAEVIDLLVNMAKAVFSSGRFDVLLGLAPGPNQAGVEALYPRLTHRGHTVLSPEKPDIEQVAVSAAHTSR